MKFNYNSLFSPNKNKITYCMKIIDHDICDIDKVHSNDIGTCPILTS